MDESAMSSAQDRAAIPSWPNWLGIVVDDLEAQRRFYSEMLELEEVDAGEDWVQFDMGQGNLFEILGRNDQPKVKTAVASSRASPSRTSRRRVLVCSSVAEAIGPVESGPSSGGAWCYFRDPEGTSSR